MGKVSNKKKLLCFYNILRELSGEEDPLSYGEIKKHFQSRMGISITPRNVTDYAKELKDFEIDVSGPRENKQGYYLRDRKFEVWELKVITDLICRSFSLSQKNSQGLIDKVAGLHNNYTEYALKKEADISRTPKTMNEEVPYTVDKLQHACWEQKKVRFTYNDYDITGSLIPRRKAGKIREYVGSPYGMLNKKNCNYSIINIDPFTSLSNYRVDRMKGMEVLKEDAKPITEVWGYSRGLNIEEYAGKCFKMFVGKESKIILEIDKSLLNFMFEELGNWAKIVGNDQDENTYLVTFIGKEGEGLIKWILQMGDKARVIAPYSLTEQVRKKIQAMAGHYNKQ